MIHVFKQAALLPQSFARTHENFWNDDYISAKLLEAHLDSEFEGASRSRDFIDRSCQWIDDVAPHEQHPSLLDLGCGPGLYAERLASVGYQVTGIDFSQRSITYAQAQARQKKLPIEYVYGSYLDMEYREEFDIAILIYCDFGALSSDERKTLLQRTYNGLKPGGVLILDVFTEMKYREFAESSTWEYQVRDGFWAERAYGALTLNHKYPEHVSLEKTVVLTEESSKSYHIWNQYFSRSRISRELEAAGFSECTYFADVKGEPYNERSETLAVVCHKY